uniref:SHSP domain-containing protein n=1 Tax=Hemiselmis andersenii TaxID=464988 RepID=A0A7S0TML2_HEMAN|mmetsp:Transcript_1976/g.4876  ORF Transcript_1976/g.4876 Transcript_1976/m.4876 type:complete len:336 (+) Transcript_1976:1335-2342(+)
MFHVCEAILIAGEGEEIQTTHSPDTARSTYEHRRAPKRPTHDTRHAMTRTTSRLSLGTHAAAAAVGILFTIALLASPAQGQVFTFRTGHQHNPSMMVLDALSSFDHFFSDKASDPSLISASSYGEGGGKAIYSEVIGVGCTPVQTLHKEIENLNSHSTIKLFVSRTCDAGHAALSNISASTDAEGELTIAATPEGSVEFRQTFALPRNADASTISATYDSTLHILTVSVQIAEPTAVDINIKTVTDAPDRPVPDAPPVTHQAPAETETAVKQEGGGKGVHGSKKSERWSRAAKEAKEQAGRGGAVPTAEDQIRKLEEELVRMRAAAAGGGQMVAH